MILWAFIIGIDATRLDHERGSTIGLTVDQNGDAAFPRCLKPSLEDPAAPCHLIERERRSPHFSNAP
jgi:hypothetical protein